MGWYFSIKNALYPSRLCAFETKKGQTSFQIVIDVEALGRIMCSVSTPSGLMGYGSFVVIW